VRADRLLSILMLLQTRGRVTAQLLAHELEVSERTIYRDLDALSAAGVPVYAERGPGGGCALVEGYRTTLTGLTRDEVRALFMLSIPAPLAELGVSGALRAALLKLAAALPAGRRSEEERVRQRIHLDPEGWPAHEEPVPHLRTIQEAVWQDRRLYLTYRLPLGAEVEWLLDPYGLVAKASAWYLMAAREGHLRVLRVSRVLAARLADETFGRPAGFDLVEDWRKWCAESEQNRPTFVVRARVAPEVVPYLARHLGEQAEEAIAAGQPAGEGGWVEMVLSFESLEAAREQILGYGRAVEVLAPWILRESVLDFSRQIVALYEGTGWASPRHG
jgi:predicted DNA-binding transcriptional regulator YafY